MASFLRSRHEWRQAADDDSFGWDRPFNSIECMQTTELGYSMDADDDQRQQPASQPSNKAHDFVCEKLREARQTVLHLSRITLAAATAKVDARLVKEEVVLARELS